MALHAGLPLGDYTALILARVHGLPDPAYIKPQKPSQQVLVPNRLGGLQQLSAFAGDAVPPPESACSVRVPPSHMAVYRDRAQAAEMPLSHYLSLVLSITHGLTNSDRDGDDLSELVRDRSAEKAAVA